MGAMIQKLMPMMMMQSFLGAMPGGIGKILNKIMPLMMMAAVMPMVTDMIGGFGF